MGRASRRAARAGCRRNGGDVSGAGRSFAGCRKQQRCRGSARSRVLADWNAEMLFFHGAEIGSQGIEAVIGV
jgi:hypothetical protein